MSFLLKLIQHISKKGTQSQYMYMYNIIIYIYVCIYIYVFIYIYEDMKVKECTIILFIPHNIPFDNQRSEINKNNIFLHFDILSFTKAFSLLHIQ